MAIDPGSEFSGWAVFHEERNYPAGFGKTSNATLIAEITKRFASYKIIPTLAIETIRPRGMAISRQSVIAQLWAGRFIERFAVRGWPIVDVDRKDVKMHLCGNARAKDANIRQAIIDRYGGKELAIGRKKAPGPLYGMAADAWQAMAIALYAAESGQEPGIIPYVKK